MDKTFVSMRHDMHLPFSGEYQDNFEKLHNIFDCCGAVFPQHRPKLKIASIFFVYESMFLKFFGGSTPY